MNSTFLEFLLLLRMKSLNWLDWPSRHLHIHQDLKDFLWQISRLLLSWYCHYLAWILLWLLHKQLHLTVQTNKAFTSDSDYSTFIFLNLWLNAVLKDHICQLIRFFINVIIFLSCFLQFIMLLWINICQLLN